ncbi:MAG TPA: hypothetical protein VGW57_04685 [Chthoniobacterales bacterium]|nr:hypothetical protein [Chthoniobacterales bacterium]
MKAWRTSTAIAAVAIIGCANSVAQVNKSQSITGLWEENGDTVHAITLREADGTYRRKLIQVYDYNRPPIKYQERGRWTVSGNQYQFTADYISTPLWSKDVAKRRNLRILSIDAKSFKYLSSDGAMVEERRLGQASKSMFEKTELVGRNR